MAGFMYSLLEFTTEHGPTKWDLFQFTLQLRHEKKFPIFLQSFLTSVLDGSERSVSRAGQFITGGKAPHTYRQGSLVSPTPDPNTLDKKRTSCHCRETNLDRAACSLISMHVTLYWLYINQIYFNFMYVL
jgi:hypothetical protein